MERPGRTTPLRARIRPSPLLGWGSDLAQATPLVYPVLVVVAPSWGYDAWLNWSSSVDLGMQAAGVGIWVVGMSVLVWAAMTLGRHMAVNELAVDHELVMHGPFRYVRHPVYSAFTSIAVGTALVFRSYLQVAVAITWATAARWWAAAEEELLPPPRDSATRTAPTSIGLAGSFPGSDRSKMTAAEQPHLEPQPTSEERPIA